MRRRFPFHVGRERENYLARRFPFHSLHAARRSAGLPAPRDRAEKFFRLTNDSGRDKRWFFPAAKYRSAARRRRAVPSRAIRRRRFRKDRPSRKNRRAGRDESLSASAVIALAIASGCGPRACTIQSAIRSAERGPTPGIWRSCTIRSLIAAGYSVRFTAGQAGPLPRASVRSTSAGSAARAGADTIGVARRARHRFGAHG